MTDVHPFDKAIALTREGRGKLARRNERGLRQHGGPFGGITAAQMLNAVMLDDGGSPIPSR